jgi:toxin ParE1/3/4
VAAVRAAGARALEGPAVYQRVHGEMRRVLLQRFPYALIFRATDDEVVVLGCVHSRRDPDLWRSRS